MASFTREDVQVWERETCSRSQTARPYQAYLHMHRILRYITQYGDYRHGILLFLTFLINLLVLVSLMGPSSKLPENGKDRFLPDNESLDLTPFAPDFDGIWYWPVIHFILGPIHLTFSLWMAMEFFLVTYPHFTFKPPNWVYRIVQKKRPVEQYLETKVFGWRTVYVMVFVVCSLLGLALWGYFYCICLLHIVQRNDSLKRVLRAVTKGGRQLLWLAVLGFCVLYIYAVITFVFFHESFLVEDDDDDLFCDTLGECFISVICYGLIDGLALSVPLVSGEFRESGKRLVYDLAFFIIVTAIGLNMVTGIIVDAFGELRDEKWKAQEDMENNCFICSIPRYRFNRVGPKEFSRHIHHDHCMWDYIYYSVYLGRIDVSDHSAIEKKVYDTFECDRTDFFPLGVALSLGITKDIRTECD